MEGERGTGERAKPRYLTVGQVVSQTGLAERTVRAMLASGRLPAVRPAGLRVVRVPEYAVLELMRARE